MTCSSCHASVRFRTNNGRTLEECRCGARYVERRTGPVALLREVVVLKRKRYKRTSHARAAEYRQAWESGESIPSIAKRYEVDYTTVMRVVKGRAS